MATKVKGIKIEFGGDTTGITKALKDIDKQARSIQGELRSVDYLLKLDPKNTELLAQKQKLLSDNISVTKDKLESLKKAKETADNDMKNGTEVNEQQYRKLQREIVETEQKLKGLDSESEKISGSGKKFKGLFDEIEAFKGKWTAAAGVVSGVAAGIAASLVSVTESTRELREDMAKLGTAFKVAGKTTESAKKIYDDFFAILGESDRSVEAVNHLAELCKNEEELSKWSNICAGVTAKFGDSLPIEGLTEASNETAKVGKVTGVLADALNWAGISEDAFNEQLSACSNEAERSALITDTLSKTYDDAAASFREANADIMASRENSQRLNEAMADLGAACEPVVTGFKNMAAGIVGGFADMITKMRETKTETSELNRKVADNAEAWKLAKQKSDEMIESNIAQIDYTGRLFEELGRLADENGKVQESDRLRAEYILGELNNALGTEYKMTGDIINQYGTLTEAVELLLAKKRAATILEGQEAAYLEAASQIQKNRNLLAEQEIQIEEQKNKILEETGYSWDNLADRQKIYQELSKSGNYKLITDLTNLQKSHAETTDVLNEQLEIRQTYEDNYAAFMSNNLEAIKGINDQEAESFRITGKETMEEMEKKVATAGLVYGNMLKEVENGNTNIRQEEIDNAATLYAEMLEEYEKIGGAIPEGMRVGIENGKPALQTSITGEGGFISTVKSWFTARVAFWINSPSKWSAEIGKFIDEGLAGGIVDNISTVKKAFKDLFGAVEEEHENLTAEETKYNEELERIRAAGQEKANEAYLDGLKKAAENAKKQRELIRSTYEGMVSDVQKEIDNLNSSMESFKNGLNDVELFREKKTTFMDTDGSTFTLSRFELSDLSAKKKELETFRDNIANLKNIGIDEAMIEQIKTLGGEKGGQLAQALLEATPEQRDLFISDFKEIGELSGQAMAEVFETEMSDVAEKTKALFAELNPDLLKIGEDWGKVLGEGVLTKLKETLVSLKSTVDLTGYGTRSVTVSNQITQNITATPQTAYDTAVETSRVMKNLTEQAVLS